MKKHKITDFESFVEWSTAYWWPVAIIVAVLVVYNVIF